MKLSGVATFKQPQQIIWDHLHDPEILKQAIPGCTDMFETSKGHYQLALKLGVAAVKGEYKGSVHLEDIETPRSYKLEADGSGNPGHVRAVMNCTLTTVDDGCEIKWECDATIGGKIANVGSRVIQGIADYMAKKFFKDFKTTIEKMESNTSL